MKLHRSQRDSDRMPYRRLAVLMLVLCALCWWSGHYRRVVRDTSEWQAEYLFHGERDSVDEVERRAAVELAQWFVRGAERGQTYRLSVSVHRGE